MTTQEKSEGLPQPNVEAGNRVADIIAGTLGLVGIAGLAEAIFDFTDEISSAAGVGVGAASVAFAITLYFTNHRDRGDSSVS
jgi:hypothetical protein